MRPRSSTKWDPKKNSPYLAVVDANLDEAGAFERAERELSNDAGLIQIDVDNAEI